jgi:hypothetical protein
MKRFYIPDISEEETAPVWMELCKRTYFSMGLTLLNRHIYALTFDNEEGRHRAEVGAELWSSRIKAIGQSLGPYVCFTDHSFYAGTPLLIARESVVSVEYFG